MIQRYIDIFNLTALIILELAVGALFIVRVRSNRSSTWVKTRIETLAIIGGVVLSFGLKILIKATHKQRN